MGDVGPLGRVHRLRTVPVGQHVNTASRSIRIYVKSRGSRGEIQFLVEVGQHVDERALAGPNRPYRAGITPAQIPVLLKKTRDYIPALSFYIQEICGSRRMVNAF